MTDTQPRRLSLAQPPVITTFGIGIHDNDQPSDYCTSGRWRLHLYHTPLTLVVDGEPVEVTAGQAGLWRPDQHLDARFTGRSVHTCVHFEVSSHAAERVALPALQDLRQRFGAIDAALVEALRWFARTPHRAEARVWDVLWQLADQAPLEPPPVIHAAVERARSHIHAHLHQRISVERLAVIAGCSASHLLRLFQKELGTPIVAYIRACRIQRARHLLQHSAIPIKDVAAEVGIPDLQLFNKLVRRELGAPPRAVRTGR
ncbi:MAG: helix-turn-helix transcriptional regulator, partial [Planctomycetes bacterium]|nr:helix-turn-helix transcriptional regulator [Planctomycetota bacterium]